MNITCYASSSAGNCYVVSCGTEHIMVECGLPIKTIRTRLLSSGIPLSSIRACLVTHLHGDHSLGALALSNSGIPVYASFETLTACGINDNAKTLTEWKQTRISDTSFYVLPFEVEHDCAGAFGFIITYATEKLLFINDTSGLKWDLSHWKFNHVMIECNYVPERLIANNDVIALRKANSHMMLDVAKDILAKLDLSRCESIYLMHLSDTNSDEPRMKKEVSEKFGIPTYVCSKNGGAQ